MKLAIPFLCSFLILISFSVKASLKPGAVIYGVVPCIYGERCFDGVMKNLDHLKDQGVDVLWISPIFESDDISIISYATTDYYKIRADFGTAQEFKNLVKAAHARQMKVIIDIIPNHTSSAHSWFSNPQMFNWFDRNATGGHTYYFDWENLPNLNYSNPLVRQMMTDVFLHWMDVYKIDGFRIDAAWGVTVRAPDYWPELIRELKKKNKDVILLAEASAMDPYYVTKNFDLAYDWHDLGVWAWKDVFTNFQRAPARLHKALTANPSAHHVARYLNNNDTGTRFITHHGLLKTKLAAVLQHTVPGVPVVYTGDEFGSEFDPYADPEPIEWNDRHGLKDFYKKLGRDERRNSSLSWWNLGPCECDL